MAKIVINAKSPCGKCYFKDGHVEDIIQFTYYSYGNIFFCTETGEYHFVLWSEPPEVEVLCDITKVCTMMVPKFAFFKQVFGMEPIVADIDKIEIELEEKDD